MGEVGEGFTGWGTELSLNPATTSYRWHTCAISLYVSSSLIQDFMPSSRSTLLPSVSRGTL
jgi:hypothetical protein